MLRAPFPAVLVLLLLPCACGGGGEDLQPGESYLDVATSPHRLFRWTPLTPGEPVELYFELHDAVSELPVAFANRFGPAELRSWVEEAVAAWLGAAGTPYLLDLASHAAGESQPPGRTVVQVSFEPSPAGRFRGSVTMYTGINFGTVVGADLVIDVPDDSGNYSSASFRSLMHHEIGHALGIIALTEGVGTSHSPFAADLMYPVAPVQALSQGDQATVSALYARVPDLVRADAAAGGLGDGPLPNFTPYAGVLGGLQAVIAAGWTPADPSDTYRFVLAHASCGG